MNAYTFTLGNVVSRKGHRGDCEHVQVVLEVDAEDEKQAEAKLKAGEGRLVSYKIGGTKGFSKPVLVKPEDWLKAAE